MRVDTWTLKGLPGVLKGFRSQPLLVKVKSSTCILGIYLTVVNHVIWCHRWTTYFLYDGTHWGLWLLYIISYIYTYAYMHTCIYTYITQVFPANFISNSALHIKSTVLSYSMDVSSIRSYHKAIYYLFDCLIEFTITVFQCHASSERCGKMLACDLIYYGYRF